MYKSLRLGLIITGLAIARTLITEVKPADAFVVHNGWNYSIDSINDSTIFDVSGNGAYEIYSSAYQVDNGIVTFAINSNVDLDNGVDEFTSNGDNKIHFGDILLNFTNKSLEAANGELFGIHFAQNNDTNVSPIGVYSDVTAISVADINNGWSSLEAYNNYVEYEGVIPTIGDLVASDPSLNLDPSKPVLNSIQSGNKIGDISFISDLNSLGLDFDFFGKTGSKTIAFSFEAALLPNSLGIYFFGMECNNDLVAGKYDPKEVPTPAAILPTIFGLFGAASRKKKITLFK